MPVNGRMDAYPVYGLNTPAEAALAMKHADGNMSTAVYVTACDQQGDVTRITMKDPVYPTTVVLCYKAYADEDMIETWTEIQNGESKPVTLTQFATCGCRISMARGLTRLVLSRSPYCLARR